MQESWSIGCMPLFCHPKLRSALARILLMWSAPKMVVLMPWNALGHAATLKQVSFCRSGAGLRANLGQKSANPVTLALTTLFVWRRQKKQLST